MRRITVALAAIASTACYDVEKSFDEFVERDKALGREAGAVVGFDAGDAGACARTDGNSRDFLLTVSTVLSPDKPTLQKANITLVDGGDFMVIVTQAYSAADRKTLVGSTSESEKITVNPDGTFKTPEMTLDIHPDANAVLPGTAATATVSLEGGRVCDDADFACGVISGTLLAPIMGDLTGSTWTAQEITDESMLPAPLKNCNRDPIPPP